MPEQEWTHHHDPEYREECPACGHGIVEREYMAMAQTRWWRWDRLKCTCEKCGYLWSAVPLHVAKRLKAEQARRAERKAGGQNA